MEGGKGNSILKTTHPSLAHAFIFSNIKLLLNESDTIHVIRISFYLASVIRNTNYPSSMWEACRTYPSPPGRIHRCLGIGVPLGVLNRENV